MHVFLRFLFFVFLVAYRLKGTPRRNATAGKYTLPGARFGGWVGRSFCFLGWWALLLFPLSFGILVFEIPLVFCAVLLISFEA